LIFASPAVLSACGSEVPAGGVKVRPAGPRVVRRIEPADLFPADLDLVVRVDVARMQAALGPALADDLTTRALEDGGDVPLRDAMARADVVWLGLRLADLDAGDRVIVIEGKFTGETKPPAGFRALPALDEGVVVLERDGGAPRSGTARILRIGDRARAFVSPVEVDSVTRVLRRGPDDRRGDPVAEGILSLDLRPRRLPSSVERRFPSIAAIVGGVNRVRASTVLVDKGIRLDAQIEGRNKAAAERTLRFLQALRDNVQGARYVELMRDLELEQVEATVRLRWVVPAKLIATLASSADPAPPDPPP
jgi:hypothetical protein